MKKQIIENCRKLLAAYRDWKLGYMKMPEDENPWFSSDENELCLAYFTLPMALNYQRNSYKLRESALQTYQDPMTKDVFDVKKSGLMSDDELRRKLMKYKLALQPNKHIQTWRKISQTVAEHRWSFAQFFVAVDNDFLILQDMVQKLHKQGFPYLSGPKIFNYRSFIIQKYWGITLRNSEYIEIAPDTHVTKCSVKLWVITAQKAENLTKEKISEKWRAVLKWSGIAPIDMHSPLWFWSRNNFMFELE